VKDRLFFIEQALTNFQADRPVFDASNSPQTIIKLLRGEIDEFEEALGTDDEEQELADVLIFAITLAQKLGYNLHPTIMAKVAFNMCRYQASDLQDGDYDEKRKFCKQREPEIKRDFSKV